jgi:hypothetical protein
MNDPTITNNAPDNRKGTGFTNLQKYLGANSGSNLDQYVGGQLSNEAGDYQKDLTQSQGQFNNDINSQYDQLNQQKNDADNVLSKYATPQDSTNTAPTTPPPTTPPPTYSTGPGLTKFAVQGSTNEQATSPNTATASTQSAAPLLSYDDYAKQYAPSDDEVNHFQSYLNPTYTGPQGLTNYDKLRSESQNLNSISSPTQNPQGLLSRYFGGGNQAYTSGQQNFDSMFLGSGDNIKQSLSQLRQINPNAVDNLNQASQGAVSDVRNKQAQQANNLRSQIGVDAYGNTLPSGGAIGNIQNSVNQRVTDFNQKAPGAVSDFRNLLNSYSYQKLSPEQRAALGQAVNYGDTSNDANVYATGATRSSYGVNPGAFLQQVAPVTAQTAINPDEAAKLSALYKLGGAQNNYDLNPALSGTAPKTPYSFNPNDFLNSVQNSQTHYQQAAAPLIAALQNSPNRDQSLQILKDLNALNAQFQQQQYQIPDQNQAINYVSNFSEPGAFGLAIGGGLAAGALAGGAATAGGVGGAGLLA